MTDEEILREENHLVYCQNCGQAATMSKETWIETFIDEVNDTMNCCHVHSYLWFFPGDIHFDRIMEATKDGEE